MFSRLAQHIDRHRLPTKATEQVAHFSPEITERLERLKSLADDPAAFAALRHEILALQIQTVPAHRQHFIVNLQAGIDAQRAISVAPVRTLTFLLQSLDDCAAAITAITQRILKETAK